MAARCFWQLAFTEVHLCLALLGCWAMSKKFRAKGFLQKKAGPGTYCRDARGRPVAV